MVHRCNELIAEENDLAKSIGKLSINKIALKQELSVATLSITDCTNTVGLYETFENENRRHIESINNHFNTLWSIFESNCTKWTTHELVSWLNCKAKERNTGLIDWDLVETILVDRNIRGKHLPHFGEKTFYSVTIGLWAKALVSEIQILVKRYQEDFHSLWREHESQWAQWNADEVVEWWQYETMCIECNVDWKYTCNLMKEKNLCGANMRELRNEVVLKFIGIDEGTTVNLLMSSIGELLSRSGMEHKSINDSIPEDLRDPISDSLMTDPVIAFDGNTYERTEIENYLIKNNSSPITGEKAPHQMLIPNNAMKKLIDAFLTKHRNGNEPGAR